MAVKKALSFLINTFNMCDTSCVNETSNDEELEVYHSFKYNEVNAQFVITWTNFSSQ